MSGMTHELTVANGRAIYSGYDRAHRTVKAADEALSRIGFERVGAWEGNPLGWLGADVRQRCESYGQRPV